MSGASPDINYRADAGTKNDSDMFFVPVQKKGQKNGPRFETKISLIFFRGIQVHF